MENLWQTSPHDEQSVGPNFLEVRDLASAKPVRLLTHPVLSVT